MHRKKPWAGMKRLAAVTAAAMLSAAAVCVPNASADQALVPFADDEPTSSTAPQVWPTLATWEAGQGTWSLTAQTRIVGPMEFAPQADLLGQEIASYREGEAAQYVTDEAAGPHDIKVTIDDTREDLGKEGYELTISSDGVSIAGATKNGAFYGTRTVSQMLRKGNEIPAGHTIDKPKFAERGVTISSFEMHHSPEWIERMLVEMADMKMNQLLLQVAIKSDREPSMNNWSYYTKAEVRSLINRAEGYGIEVIPEVNSPGHAATIIQGHPEFWLVDDHGQKQPNQLDVCNPDAVQYYLDVMDEYIEVYQPRQWNVGGDEYMHNKNAADYQGLIDCVKKRYGEDAVVEGNPEATISNAVVDFVNTVNAHAKKRGLDNIRVWNDGLHASAKVKLDKDIIIEHWVRYGEGEKPDQILPQEFFDDGYRMQNASGLMYDIRKAGGGEVAHTNWMWDDRWNVGIFYDSPQIDLDNPQLMGGKVSMWPDDFWAQTENTVQERVREGMAMMAQVTWTADYDDLNYEQFKTTVETLERSPEWNNVDDMAVAEGKYRVRLQDDPSRVMTGNEAKADGEGSFTFTVTDDRYYQLKDDASGKCLAFNEGYYQEQGVVIEVGAAPSLEECGQLDAEETNKQKWQVLRQGDGSFEIRHALSGMHLAVTTGEERKPQEPEGAALPAGRLAQLPMDMTDDHWVVEPLEGSPAIASPSPDEAAAQPSSEPTDSASPSATPSAGAPTPPAKRPGLPKTGR